MSPVEIEYTLTRTEAVFGKTHQFTCKFVALREKDGTMYGIMRQDEADPQFAWTYVNKRSSLIDVVVH